MKVIVFVLLTLCCVSVHAQSCKTCNKKKCPKLSCEGSTTLDRCKCCRECTKQEGETCGGLGGISGTCEKGLVCLHEEPKITPAGLEVFHHRGQSPGQCMRTYKTCAEACADPTIPTSAAHLSVQGKSVVLAPTFERTGFWAYCDCSAGADNAWLVIQRRASRVTNFDLGWTNYEQGFGISGDDFWLGLKRMYRFTSAAPHEAMIVVQYEDTYTTYSTYGFFQVGNPGSGYKLNLRENSGENSLEFMENHRGMSFSASDKDNDQWSGECAKWFRGGWWFNKCTHQNLNGVHYGTSTLAGVPRQDGPDAITWNACRTQQIRTVEIKIRPVKK